jgi:hypothetical protein
MRHAAAKTGVAKRISCRPALARLAFQGHASSRAQTRQTPRPCPSAPVSKVWFSLAYASARIGPGKTRPVCAGGARFHVHPPKSAGPRESVPAPNRACWLPTWHMSQRALCTLWAPPRPRAAASSPIKAPLQGFNDSFQNTGHCCV